MKFGMLMAIHIIITLLTDDKFLKFILKFNKYTQALYGFIYVRNKAVKRKSVLKMITIFKYAKLSEEEKDDIF